MGTGRPSTLESLRKANPAVKLAIIGPFFIFLVVIVVNVLEPLFGIR